jgi:hypothetical protein
MSDFPTYRHRLGSRTFDSAAISHTHLAAGWVLVGEDEALAAPVVDDAPPVVIPANKGKRRKEQD